MEHVVLDNAVWGEGTAAHRLTAPTVPTFKSIELDQQLEIRKMI